jgi:hypothetical protein
MKSFASLAERIRNNRITIIRVGDTVTWRPGMARTIAAGRGVMPMPLNDCKVVDLCDVDGKSCAVIETGIFGLRTVLVADLEPAPKQTILSGG